MRVLVCGGRFYNRVATFGIAMDRIHDEILRWDPPTVVIHGKCKTGADDMAQTWADNHGYPVLPFPAKWKDLSHPDAVIRFLRDGTSYDAMAGPRRNQQAIDEGKPDIGVAFPGDRGTNDMVDRLKKANIRLIDLRKMTTAKDLKLS